jgi:hypothetical protein
MYRSITGAQRNFTAYGSPTREKTPITARSTPSEAIHAWRVEPVRARGIPEENPNRRTKKILRLPNADRIADMGGIVPSIRILVSAGPLMVPGKGRKMIGEDGPGWISGG